MSETDQPAVELAAERSLRHATQRRVTLMMRIVLGMLFVDTLFTLLLTDPTATWSASVFMRFLGLAVLGGFVGFQRKGGGPALTFGFLCSLELLLHAMAWLGNGAGSLALVGGAGVFAIAAALCRPWQFIGLVLAHLLGMTLLYVDNRHGDMTVARAVDGLLVWLAVAVVIGVFARDLRRFKRAAQREFAYAESARSLAEFRASHDELTRLPNRMLGRERTAQLVAAAQEGGFRFGFMHLNLSDFRFINDSLGHAAGDLLLQQAAARLQRAAGRQDTVARAGSDEFMIAVHGPVTELELALLARRLLAAVAEPIDYQGLEIRAEACAGIAIFPNDGMDFEALSRCASAAVQVVKSRNDAGTFFFSSRPVDDAVRLQLRKLDGLRRAHEFSTLVLRLEPQHELESGGLVGCQARWHWTEAEFGALGTDELVAIAEAAGLAADFGAWLCREACTELQRLRSRGAELGLSIAVHAAHVRRGDLLGDVQSALAQSGLPAASLVLEFDEALLHQDAADAEELLGRLHRLGVGLAVRGSHVPRIPALPFQWLKLAPRRRKDGEWADLSTLGPLVAAATRAGLRCSVEGVASTAEAQQLAVLGCARGQGPCWSGPLSEADFERLLAG